jgi:hypothetical protein
MTPKHTPGPWVVDEDEDGYEIATGGASPISATVATVVTRQSETGRADADLIAASPALIAFVREFAEWWRDAGCLYYADGCDDEDNGLEGLADEAVALLAKFEAAS